MNNLEKSVIRGNMTDDELQDVDNEINPLKDLLNSSNLRLAEEQIKNEELKAQLKHLEDRICSLRRKNASLKK